MNPKQPELTKKERIDTLVSIWQTCIETQQHFNDMLMKVRNFGFVLIAAILGATGFSLRSKYQVGDIPIGSFIIFFGAILWGLIFFLEAKWYTPLLIGAVNTGQEIENILKEEYKNECSSSLEHFLLSNSIKDTSSNVYIINRLKAIKINSQRRSRIFHWTFIVLLFSLSAAIFFSSDDISSQSTPPKTEVTATKGDTMEPKPEKSPTAQKGETNAALSQRRMIKNPRQTVSIKK